MRITVPVATNVKSARMQRTNPRIHERSGARGTRIAHARNGIVGADRHRDPGRAERGAGRHEYDAHRSATELHRRKRCARHCRKRRVDRALDVRTGAAGVACRTALAAALTTSRGNGRGGDRAKRRAEHRIGHDRAGRAEEADEQKYPRARDAVRP
jgi:methylmalonyl-CoA mutase N-terminal domain/subunit